MRTSFHHQSEAQPPNGPLTAATSPDTPSLTPATQSRLGGSSTAPRHVLGADLNRSESRRGVRAIQDDSASLKYETLGGGHNLILTTRC